MGYQVLARKWRPRTFKEMIGQAHVVQALSNAMLGGRLHHAYLFTGTRGVGKTTLARVVAKCLNCETGVTADPCGVCSACTDIDQGRFIDLIEVDAASRTKVEDTRELLENIHYAPTQGRFKIYLIDEVHMLSTHSFNALLKTLEEPPAHVKFLLATTDPQKLPVTVLSRCLQFCLKPMTPDFIVEHLQTLLTKEGVTFDQGSLWALARAANGSMRDALSLTEQAIAYSGGHMEERALLAMLGVMDRQLVRSLLEAVIDDRRQDVLTIISLMAEQSADFSDVLVQLQRLAHQLALAKSIPFPVSVPEPDRAWLAIWVEKVTPEALQIYFQALAQGRRDLMWAPDARSGCEMTVLRMLAFRPLVMPDADERMMNRPVGVSSDRLSGSDNHSAPVNSVARSPSHPSHVIPDRGNSAEENSGKGAVAATMIPPEALSSAKKKDPGHIDESPLGLSHVSGFNARSVSNERIASRVGSHASASDSIVDLPAASAMTPQHHAVPLAEVQRIPASAEAWCELISVLDMPLNIANLAKQMVATAWNGGVWRFQLNPAMGALLKDHYSKAIEAALSAYYDEPQSVVIELRVPTGLTPEQHLRAAKASKKAEQEKIFRELPFVSALLEKAEGRIVNVEPMSDP